MLLEWKCIRKLIYEQKPDLLMVSVGSPGKYLGCLLLPGKVLYVLHTYPHLANGEPANFSYLKKYLLGLFLSPKKQIVTVSEFAQIKIASSWLLATKQHLVQYVHNTAGPVIENRIMHNHTDKGINKLRILTLGHVTWYKSPGLWLEVAKRVIANRSNMDIEFIWAGEGDQLLPCKKWVIENGLTGSIKFIGFQFNVAKLYKDCDIYFQPSVVESHGLSVIEAMRYSLPCVVSNVGGLPESILHEKTGYIVKVNDADEAVRRILQLAQNRELRKELGRAGQAYYKSCFSDSIWDKKMKSIHQKILGTLLSESPESK